MSLQRGSFKTVNKKAEIFLLNRNSVVQLQETIELENSLKFCEEILTQGLLNTVNSIFVQSSNMTFNQNYHDPDTSDITKRDYLGIQNIVFQKVAERFQARPSVLELKDLPQIFSSSNKDISLSRLCRQLNDSNQLLTTQPSQQERSKLVFHSANDSFGSDNQVITKQRINRQIQTDNEDFTDMDDKLYAMQSPSVSSISSKQNPEQSEVIFSKKFRQEESIQYGKEQNYVRSTPQIHPIEQEEKKQNQIKTKSDQNQYQQKEYLHQKQESHIRDNQLEQSFESQNIISEHRSQYKEIPQNKHQNLIEKKQQPVAQQKPQPELQIKTTEQIQSHQIRPKVYVPIDSQIQKPLSITIPSDQFQRNQRNQTTDTKPPSNMYEKVANLYRDQLQEKSLSKKYFVETKKYANKSVDRSFASTTSEKKKETTKIVPRKQQPTRFESETDEEHQQSIKVNNAQKQQGVPKQSKQNNFKLYGQLKQQVNQKKHDKPYPYPGQNQSYLEQHHQQSGKYGFDEISNIQQLRDSKNSEKLKNSRSQSLSKLQLKIDQILLESVGKKQAQTDSLAEFPIQFSMVSQDNKQQELMIQEVKQDLQQLRNKMEGQISPSYKQQSSINRSKWSNSDIKKTECSKIPQAQQQNQKINQKKQEPQQINFALDPNLVGKYTKVQGKSSITLPMPLVSDMNYMKHNGSVDMLQESDSKKFKAPWEQSFNESSQQSIETPQRFSPTKISSNKVSPTKLEKQNRETKHSFKLSELEDFEDDPPVIQINLEDLKNFKMSND